MRLKISKTIANEWESRSIGGVIPALDEVDYGSGFIEVSDRVAGEIAKDCEFYMDPNAVDAFVGERRAYAALRAQIVA